MSFEDDFYRRMPEIQGEPPHPHVVLARKAAKITAAVLVVVFVAVIVADAFVMPYKHKKIESSLAKLRQTFDRRIQNRLETAAMAVYARQQARSVHTYVLQNTTVDFSTITTAIYSVGAGGGAGSGAGGNGQVLVREYPQSGYVTVGTAVNPFYYSAREFK